jgi:glycosyltransferase involved in cell wall biosynthesis
MFKVLIICKSIPQYRIAFFNLLRTELSKDHISLELICGDDSQKGRNDSETIDWAIFKPNKYIKIFGLTLIWQPCLKEVESSDLVIVEQAIRLLINYVLIGKRIIGSQKLAFWGHGLNMQANKYSFANIFKRLCILNHCDWWFAYTSGIKSFLINNGYLANRITVVQNAIDTMQMRNDYDDIKDDELQAVRELYGLQRAENILIYCGDFYKEKRLSFLIDTADILIERGHNFKLLVAGGGPDEYIIKKAALTRPYLVFTGPLFGRKKALMFKLSSIFLLPGAMGLAILDSFAFETPVIATKYDFHGPEFEYLVDGYNGIVTENDLMNYANGVSDMLSNNAKLQQIVSNCKSEYKKYSIEIMVSNFTDGVKNFIHSKVKMELSI